MANLTPAYLITVLGEDQRTVLACRPVTKYGAVHHLVRYMRDEVTQPYGVITKHCRGDLVDTYV